MKSSSPPLAVGALIAGVIAMVGIGIYANWTHLLTPPQMGQMAQMGGEKGGALNSVFLKGGLLQQGLDQASPEVFLEVDTGTETPQFLTRKLTVRTNQVVSITLRNRSTLDHHHNWVLVSPGTRNKVQSEAERAGPTWQWIPNSSDILAFVPLTPPAQSTTILFRSPKSPGEYPFLCTFPGHGNIMNGILHVVE